jgi:hypothetical protein
MKETYSQKSDVLKEQTTEKRRATCKQNYGVDNVAKSKKVKQIIQETCLERYGYPFSLMAEHVRLRTDETSHSKESYQKRKDTCMKKRGVDHHMKDPKVIKKVFETYKKTTGYDHPMKNPEVKKAMIEKYGEIGRVKGYWYEDTHFDSSFELAYYIWLKDNDRQFLYHPPFTFEYIGDDNETHVYHPDFLVEGKFYEIKGTQFFNNKGEPYNMYTKSFWWEKYRSMKDNGVVILLKEDLKEVFSHIEELYGKKFLHQFKL